MCERNTNTLSMVSSQAWPCSDKKVSRKKEDEKEVNMLEKKLIRQTGSELCHKNANRIVNIVMNYVTLLAYLPLFQWMIVIIAGIVVYCCWSANRQWMKQPISSRAAHKVCLMSMVKSILYRVLWCFGWCAVMQR